MTTSTKRPLEGHRAAVLGSTSGIGRATALLLAEEGASVIIHGNRSRSMAESVAEECRAKGVKAEVLMADLSNRDEGDKLVHRPGISGEGSIPGSISPGPTR